MDALVEDLRGDVRDGLALTSAFNRIRPDTVLHLAAQPLVIEGLRDPVGTFSTNVMGTVNVLEACMRTASVRSCVVVTTDKVYKEGPRDLPHSEEDELGGHEPYGASKAAAELVASSFITLSHDEGPQIATARAGNVIGGGDWSQRRLLPDLLAALDTGREVPLRSPRAVRPWQHVLDPLTGYLLLAEKLELGTFADLPRSWNFGPDSHDARTVMDVVNAVECVSGEKLHVRIEQASTVESAYLALSSSRAHEGLGWCSRWDFDSSVAQTVEWHLSWRAGGDVGELSRALVSQQLGQAENA